MLGIRFRSGRPVVRSLDDICKHLSNKQFSPKTIVDVGVANGTIELYRHFFGAKLELVEPIQEFSPSIEDILKEIPGRAHYVAAGSEDGEFRFEASTKLHELHNAKLVTGDGEHTRIVPMRRLDTILHEAEGPILLKVDVEGFELDVLRGAKNLMKLVDVVIIETRLLRVIEGTSIFNEVCQYMQDQGFQVYDIVDMIARPLDDALILCDLVFVRNTSSLVEDTRYETQEQIMRHERRLWPTFRRKMNF
jgi:FkbM family methyltransferase